MVLPNLKVAKLLKYFLLYISLLILIVAYNGSSNEKYLEKNTASIQSKDSISIWIKSSKDKSHTYLERKTYLNKSLAYIQTVADDSLKNSFLLEMSLAYFSLGDTIGFRNVNKQSIDLSHKLNDSTSLASNYWDLAEFHSKKGAQDSAYYSFSKAQKIYDKLKNYHLSGRMFLNMAIIQSDIKDYTGSEITTIKAISLLKPLSKYEHLYRCYNNLGICFNNLEEYDKAIESHNIALNYQKEIKGKNTYKENSLNNLGVVFKNVNDFEKAIQYYELALKVKNLKNRNTKLYAKLLDNLAYSKFKSNDTVSVKNLFYRSLKIRDSIHDYLGLAVNKLHLAEYYAFTNDSAKATQFALETKQLAFETKNYRELLPSLLLLSKLDKHNSSYYTSQYIKLNDSLQKEERTIRNKFARIQFETDEVIYRNERLSRQKQLILLIASSIFLLGILLYIIIIQRIKNRKLKFKQQQQKANEEIYNLMLAQQDKLDEGRNKEKKRISEELHDGVLGKLFGTRLILGSLNAKTDEDSIGKREKCINDLQEIEEEVRNVSHELNSKSQVSNISYTQLINSLLNDQSSITNFEYELEFDEHIFWEEINGGLKMNLYRIIQEAIQNINKYSKAQHVNVEFKIDESNLFLSIKDDGIGFNVTTKRKGIGLKNMKSRTAKLNGKLSVISEPKKGTLIRVTIPLNKEAIIQENSTG